MCGREGAFIDFFKREKWCILEGMRKVFLFLLFPVLLGGFQAVFFPSPILALSISNTFRVTDDRAVDGDILINTSSGFVRANLPYDNRIFGVLTDKPALVFRTEGTLEKPVVSSGIATVNVVTTEGNINVGDYITSSATSGKGVKASRSGYVLGTALEGFSGSGAGRIQVAIRVEYAEITTARSANRLFEYLGASFLSNVKNPEKFGQIVRYIFAGLVLLISFGLGFSTFSKSLPKGIEAVGRNPLAKTTIYLTMALNVGLIVIVGVLGIAAALLILRL